jgi:hypothetical protein
MKKAPDKIYLREFGDSLSQVWSGIKPTEETIIASHEYIRKEALLEWLENKIKISDGGFVNGLVCLAYKDIIEHLNGM